jgi:hypothetical protein
MCNLKMTKQIHLCKINGSHEWVNKTKQTCQIGKSIVSKTQRECLHCGLKVTQRLPLKPKIQLIIPDNEMVVCMNAFLLGGAVKSLQSLTESDIEKIKIIEITTIKL